jgi:hypothetical protein
MRKRSVSLFSLKRIRKFERPEELSYRIPPRPLERLGTPMAIREKIRENASAFLQPGEIIQAVVPAQTVSAYFSLISIWIIVFKNAYRNIVVTDRRILLCSSGRFRSSPVKGILAEYPRQLTIGPAHGLWYRCDAFGDRLYINKRFFKDVAMADQGAQ